MSDIYLNQVAQWDMSNINPADIGWKASGLNGTGVNLVQATDVLNGIAGGMATEYNGVDEYTNFGDIGNITTISLWFKAVTNTEELVLIDAGKDIMINAGTITYTGVAAAATYINGAATTTAVASMWQHLVAVLNASTDANTFQFATDGVNFGAVIIDEAMVFDAALTQLQARSIYEMQKRGKL